MPRVPDAPSAALPTYVAHFVSGDMRSLQRAIALRGARQVGAPRRVANVRGVRAYELTLVSNYAVLELLQDRFGAHPLHYIVEGSPRQVWFSAVRPKYLNGHQLDLLRRQIRHP